MSTPVIRPAPAFWLPVLLAIPAACIHPGEGELAYAGGDAVTVVQQTNVQQTNIENQTNVQQNIGHLTVNHPSVGIDCGMLCSSVGAACRQACAPTAWSPNMSAIESHCGNSCDFREFSCVHSCLDSGGHCNGLSMCRD